MSNQLLSNFYQQVNPDNTMSFNRLLAHSIGIAETIIYYSLIGKYYYYLNREMIDENGWFYVTVPDLQESTSYGEKGQRNAINHLERLGFICTAKKGVPAKRYFRIVDDEKLYQEHLANGKRICEEIKSKAAETCERKISARNAEKNKNNEKSALNAVEFQFRPLDGTSSAEFENKEKVLQSPKNSSSVHWTEQVTSKGRNKSRPNGGTSDVQTADKSKTNKSKTNKYNINLSIYQDNINNINNNTYRCEDFDSIDTIRETIKQNIDYDYLAEDYSSRRDELDELVEIMTECLCCTEPTLRVGKQNMDSEVVRSQFMKLNHEHIGYVLDSLATNTTRIKNMKAYLITSLYNAPMTISNHVAAQVRCDFPNMVKSITPYQLE